MNWINYDDAVGQLVDAGFQEPRGGWTSGIDCGRKTGVRCKVDGCRQGGWFALHTIKLDNGADALIGAYCSYRGAESDLRKIVLRVDGKAHKLTAEQREVIKARQRAAQAAADAEQQRKNDRAALRAMHVWSMCQADGQSPYLAKKGVGAYGVKYSPSGALVIPMADTSGRIHGLQVIRPAKQNGRDKDFWPVGMAKKGHFHQIGTPTTLCLVAEGYATAASLHEATGIPVVVAFDAANLLPVAQAIGKKYRSAKLLICADDDYLTDGNPGVTSAANTAAAVSGAWVAPTFSADRDGKKITDFNDLHALEGIGAVRAQIETRLAALGWAQATQNAAQRSAQGGGEESEQRSARAIMDLDDIVARFVSIDDGTGDYVFDLWKNRIAKRSQVTALLPAGVRSDDIKRHPVWQSRAYFLDEVGFDPSGKDPSVKLNTWQGWPLKPQAGSCERLLELIEYHCGNEANAREVFDFLIKWLAYPLQHPGAKMSSAVIMHGPQGTGKTTIFKAMTKIYGQYALVVDQDAIEDKFNSDWGENRLFLLAEEIVSRAEMWHVKNKLKNLVTGETIRINPKGTIAYSQKNHLNIVYLSNENQPLPLENDDRRHFVIYNPPPMTAAFYDELFSELDNGGVEAFYDYLLHVDLTGFHANSRPPMTAAKQALIALSAASEVRYTVEWLAGDLGIPVCPCASTDYYAQYLAWCRRNGESRPAASNRFYQAVEKQAGLTRKKLRIYATQSATETTPTWLIFPPAKTIDRTLAEQKDGASEAQWHTACVRKFRAATRQSDDFNQEYGT